MFEVLRYGAVGCAVFALDALVFSLFLYMAPSAYLAANITGRLAGAGSGFYLHKYVSFPGIQGRPVYHQALGYGLLLLANMVASSALLYAAVTLIFLPTLPSRIAIDIVMIIITFVINKWVIFQRIDHDD